MTLLAADGAADRDISTDQLRQTLAQCLNQMHSAPARVLLDRKSVV